MKDSLSVDRGSSIRLALASSAHAAFDGAIPAKPRYSIYVVGYVNVALPTVQVMSSGLLKSVALAEFVAAVIDAVSDGMVLAIATKCRRSE